MIFFNKGHRIFLLSLVVNALLLPVSLFAQIEEDGGPMHLLADSVYQEDKLAIDDNERSPWNLNTNVGTSVSFMPGYGAGSSFYAAPHLDFSATKRLVLHGGFIASYGVPMYNSSDSEFGNMASYANLSAFVAASYRLTDNLVVYGTGMKSMMSAGMPGFNPHLALDDVSFGAAYSFGNFTIGASIHSGNVNGFGNSSYNSGRGIYPSPFLW